jgi:hypothetical protein
MAEEEAARKDIGRVETKEPEFRELTRLRAFDRQMHIQKSIEMGMSREEAERHAEHDLEDRDDAVP